MFAAASAPATVANVGPGFDVFGFALEGPCDHVQVRRVSTPGVRLVGAVDPTLPRVVTKNVATAVALRMLRAVNARFGVEVTLTKGLPLGSGLGSSSASAVAATVAMHRLLGERFTDDELLDFARFGEKVACGAAHADNVAPALFGGFTLVRGGSPVEIIRIDVPKNWRVVVVHPHLELPTKKARAALPLSVALRTMTANVANAASLIAALYKKDLALFGRALMGDAIVTPVRKRLIPGCDVAMRAAIQAGAAGVSISGAGPSIFALTDSDAHAKLVARRIAAAWCRSGTETDIFVSRIGARGALQRGPL